jgi:hypothetical protein
MNKSNLAKAIWLAAAIAVAALCVVLRTPTAQTKFEHPHRTIVTDAPIAVDLSENAYVPPPLVVAPPPPPVPIFMHGAKIVVDQPSQDPQPLAHSQSGRPTQAGN